MLDRRRNLAVIATAFIACSVVFEAKQRSSVAVSSPPAVVVALPPIPAAEAIWGATGQDARGHIWIGVTAKAQPANSAHLVEYIPSTGTMTGHGDVVSELQRAGIWRSGEHQAKIHSKIVQGPGGYLYFSSMDESGENEDGSRLPTWGGHLWRMNIASGRWQHLLATPEALIAVGGGSRFIYALGYFGHVLYQYDTRDGSTRNVRVGSVDGHVSRNFLVDARGHAYVPRLVAQATSPDAPRSVRVALVEFDTQLRELRATPLDPAQYLGARDATGSHGIVGLQAMADGSIYFTTHAGYLHRVAPPGADADGRVGDGAADVSGLGWIHPNGGSYAPTLFTSDGTRTLSSLVRRSGQPWEWVTCELPALRCRVATLEIAALGPPEGFGGTLFYGSSTRDAEGGHYVVGVSRSRPIVVRIQGERP